MVIRNSKVEICQIVKQRHQKIILEERHHELRSHGRTTPVAENRA